MAPDELARRALRRSRRRRRRAPSRRGRRSVAGRHPRRDPPISASAALIASRALRDLLVGERPVGGAELEPQREALAALADLLAAVEVEDVGRAQQLAPAVERPPRGPRSAATSSSTTTARSSLDGRDRRSRPRSARRRAARRRAAAPRSTSKPAAASRSHVAAHERVELADPAAPASPATHGRGARPGCRNGSSAGSTRSSAPSRPASASSTPLSAKKSRRRRLAAPARRRGGPTASGADPVGLDAGAGRSPANCPASDAVADRLAARAGRRGRTRTARRARRRGRGCSARRRAAPPSSVVRIAECSSESGLETAIGGARGSSVAEPQPRRHRRGR